jgi:acetyltransferase-like isoleucine patch superfamily enzyme
MTTNIQQPIDLLKNQQKTALIVAVFGSIPLAAGQKLRRFVYPFVLGRMGADVQIETGLELLNAPDIFLGNQVSIARNISLNAWHHGSKLIIRDHVRLDQGICFQTLGGRIEVGEKTYIGAYVCISGPGNIKIGKNCLIAAQTGLYASNHIFEALNLPINQQGAECKGIVIEDDCWLGSGVKVLDGVTIGQGSVIGAGAVVTKNIPPYSVAVGVPAKVIAHRGEAEEPDRIVAAYN